MQDIIKKADVLIEASAYIHAFRKKTVVIKYGGSILGEDKIRRSVLEDIVFLSLIGLRPVLIHGGGPNITERMKQTGKKTEFIEGMRYTDLDTLKIVREELDYLNEKIVKEINLLKGSAVSLKGEEGIIEAQKKRGKKDLGFVGEVNKIDKNKIESHLKKDFIPVISPMGLGQDRYVYNINADEAASFIAVSLSAEKFVLLTNVKGIMRSSSDVDSFISTLNIKEAKAMIKEKVIQEGMIPKVNACINALEAGVKKTHIIDARIQHALLLEIFTDKGIGTEIVR
ncbi:MAG: acetylglutamate kinase [Candidatus Omnitrophota bacterium]|nr:acetylglutamate kinase [Candidatus Omnitrophota bacterium]